jgi:hypothetical protein
MVSGWAAFAAWLIAAVLFLGSQSLNVTVEATLTSGLVGAAIGAGLNLVSGMSNAQWKRQLRRVAPGLVGGGVGGALGGLIGSLAFSGLGLPRTLGWMIMGLGVGAAEGVYERSSRKLRNGLIGGSLGGILGGLLFDPIAGGGSGMFSQSLAFVILGLAVGALIGLTHVVLKEAWLTVVDGFRAGRQLILSQPVTVLGRGDHLPLPFLGYGGKDLESEHLRLVRQANGTYLAEDNHSRIGTRINGQLIQGPVALHDGDLIRLGTNIVRFNQSHRWARQRGEDSPGQLVASVGKIAPPPPPPSSASSVAPSPVPTVPRPSMTTPPQALPQSPGIPCPSPQSGRNPRIPPPPPPPT